MLHRDRYVGTPTSKLGIKGAKVALENILLDAREVADELFPVDLHGVRRWI
jgi:hypothetical protein